jgi:hypothetical protein
VKQRTYLAILLFIWLSCPYLAILPCPIAPPRQRNSKKTKRNLFCTTPLCSRGLVRRLRFLRTSSAGNTTPVNSSTPTTRGHDVGDGPPVTRCPHVEHPGCRASCDSTRACRPLRKHSSCHRPSATVTSSASFGVTTIFWGPLVGSECSVSLY